jgi:CTP:molybdopterin cytidylyltransferase MocA/SAM-dependent methyltransferase
VTAAAETVGLVLAAGSASRFGSAKLLAPLDGRPVLQHVVDIATGVGLAGVVVVLGAEADAIEATVDWRSAATVRNPHPEAGLSSSVRVGLDAVHELFPGIEAVLVLLGDQPRVRAGVIGRLLDEPLDRDRVVVVPRYASGAGPNPVLLAAAAWSLAEHIGGDRGFGPVLAAHPELVAEVAVDGDNPDVDTPDDLARIQGAATGEGRGDDPAAPTAAATELAATSPAATELAAWSARVRANREQVDRVREVPDGPDFYGPVSSMFIADPDRTDDPQLEVLLRIARPTDTWLDIGAGAGRFALPLARRVRAVIAIDPSAGMLDGLRAGMAEHHLENIRIVHGRWPLDAAAGPLPRVDVALIAHLGYDIEAIGPFLDAMEAATVRECVAVLMERQPASSADAFWPPVHGEARVPLPALRELVDLLAARGRRPTVVETSRPPRGFTTPDELERFVRRQLWVAPGSAKDEVFRSLLAEIAVERDGRWWLEDRPLPVGVVRWSPGAAGDPGGRR